MLVLDLFEALCCEWLTGWQERGPCKLCNKDNKITLRWNMLTCRLDLRTEPSKCRHNISAKR